MLDKRGRLIARESNSKCDSERKQGFIVGDYSEGSGDLDGQDRSSD